MPFIPNVFRTFIKHKQSYIPCKTNKPFIISRQQESQITLEDDKCADENIAWWKQQHDENELGQQLS